MFDLPVLEENHKKNLWELVFSCEIYGTIDTKNSPLCCHRVYKSQFKLMFCESKCHLKIVYDCSFHLSVFEEENIHN